jgi:hypothetical protein
MTFDLEVDADAVRVCVSALAVTTAEIVTGSAPPSPPPAPSWESTAAATSLAGAFHQVLLTEAADLEAFRRSVLAAIAEYESADDRAADRLRANR